MKFSGAYDLNVERQTVWEALNNHKILKQCIPGCEIFKKESDNVFNVKATNQIGPMNATFSGKIILSKIVVNQSYTLSGEGQSSVGFANGSADIKLSEKNGFTTLTYEVNVNVGGKIAQVGSRLIDGVAKKMSDYFFGRFSDLVSPLKKQSGEIGVQKRTIELKSDFLNKYFYSAILILILLLVVIFYFVSR